MPQSKEVHRAYMRKKRQGSQNTPQGSQNIQHGSQGKEIQIDKDKAIRLTRICHSLDKQITGLGGKQGNLLDMVRLGVSGPTMREVKYWLSEL